MADETITQPAAPTIEETLAAQEARIAALEAKLAAKETSASTSITVDGKTTKPTVPKDTVTSGKKQYKFTVAQFRLPGDSKTIISEEASLDQTTIDKIVAIQGQSILKEQV